MISEAHLSDREKFIARQIVWFDPRPAKILRAIVPSMIGVVLLFFVVGAALALGAPS